ncbi:MAG: NapH/MauN family ferredoxin-type protein [Coriobacteriia bacterium]|nr:NapH/MauN family ferredoxin-type protein [Coriobacteriia bacterium]
MKRWLIARRTVQILVWVVFCTPLVVAGFSLLGLTPGVEDAVQTPAQGIFFGSLSASQILNFDILDPFATLQTMVASRSFDLAWLWGLLPVLLVYVIIGSRAFCGWICPVNLLLEFVDWLRKKLRIPNAGRRLPRRTKIAVMVLFLLLALICAQPLFENISPIAALGKTLLYGSMAGLGTLVGIIVLELFWAPRIWCRSLCPLGGFYELFGRVGIFRVRIKHDACTHCGKCETACIAAPEILKPALAGSTKRVCAGDCLRCGACIDACPTHALSMRPF